MNDKPQLMMFSALKFPVLLTYVLTAMKTSASDVWLSDVLMKYVLVEIAHCSRDHILICIFIDYLSTKNKVFFVLCCFFFFIYSANTVGFVPFFTEYSIT